MVAHLDILYVSGDRKCQNQYPHLFLNSKIPPPSEGVLVQPALLTFKTKQYVHSGVWKPKFDC